MGQSASSHSEGREGEGEAQRGPSETSAPQSYAALALRSFRASWGAGEAREVLARMGPPATHEKRFRQQHAQNGRRPTYDELESKVARVNATMGAVRRAEEYMGGLRLSFRVETYVATPAMARFAFARVPGAVAVLVTGERRCRHSDLVLRGPTRAALPAGFDFLVYLLEELASSAVSLEGLKRRRLERGVPGLVPAPEEDECPVCMDRKVDVVLSCSHGLCTVCELEWMVGEGRGTCPLCRATQKDLRDDWVLENHGRADPLETRVEDLQAHVALVVSDLMTYLINLPTREEFLSVLVLPQWIGVAPRVEVPREDYQRDALGCWMRAELRIFELTHATAGHEEEEEGLEAWCRCPNCESGVRVPSTATEDDWLRCAACTRMFSRGELVSLTSMSPMAEGLGLMSYY